MKFRKPAIVATGLALALSACIPSLNSYFTEKDLVSEPRLAGDWKAEDGSMTWSFVDEGDKSFTLTVTETEKETPKTGTLSAHVFKIGNEMFLDLIPTKCEFAKDQTDLVSMAVFPGHLLARVTSVQPELKVQFFNWDWLQKHLSANPAALAHHVENKDQIILTAQTEELQKFVSQHLGADQLFGDVGTFKRVTATTPPAAAPSAAKP